MGESEQEIEIRNLRTEVEGLYRYLNDAQQAVIDLHAENEQLAERETEVEALSKWAAELLTAFADREVARQYSGEWREAHERFWHSIETTPAAVRERVDPERVYFLEVVNEGDS